MSRGVTLAGLLAAAALLAVPHDGAAQGYRVRLDSRIQSVAWRGLEADSIPASAAIGQPNGSFLTPDGYAARCEGAYCFYFRSGATLRGVPWVTQADLSIWGLGVAGLSARANVRLAQDLGDEASWPGTEPDLQLYEGYLEYARAAVTARAGRQFLTGRLGAYGLDGGRVLLRLGGSGLEVGGYGGWGLARGTALPVTDPALNPLDDFQPRDRQVVAGAEVGWNGARADVRAEYRREVDPAVDYFVSERAAVALSLGPLAGVRLTGGLVYDLAFGQLGPADVALSWLGPRVAVTAGARHYRPLFDLWTIWGAFSPVGYRAVHGSVEVRPLAGVSVYVRGERYDYEDTETSTPLVDTEDDGWRTESSVTWSPDARWTVMAGHHAEFGPGASSLGYRGRIAFDPSDRFGVAVHAANLRRPLELRFSDADLIVYGADASWRPDARWRLEVSASRYQEERDRPDAAALDWDQFRVSARISLLFGSSADRLPLPRAVRRGTGS